MEFPEWTIEQRRYAWAQIIRAARHFRKRSYMRGGQHLLDGQVLAVFFAGARLALGDHDREEWRLDAKAGRSELDYSQEARAARRAELAAIPGPVMIPEVAGVDQATATILPSSATGESSQ